MSNKKIAINLITNSISFIVAFGISFFLTPFIVKNVGAEAYGFVSLATNFVTYISLITVALNSMAGRYVSIKIHQNDMEGANKYFSSVIFANITISIILILPSIIVVSFIDRFINIPVELISDVRILFLLVFIGFFISLITSLFSVALFVTNNLYLSALRQIEGAILKAVLTYLLFSYLPIKVFYISLISIIIQVYIALWNLHYTKKMLSDIKVSKKYFDLNAIKELISSGVWNTVNRLSYILNVGLDLLISNLFIGAGAMGTLAIAKTIPAMITNILGMFASVFGPDFTRFYAKDQFEEMVKLLKRSIKLLGVFVNIPVAGLIVFGDIFYALWIPAQNSRQLHILSILTIAALIINGSTASLSSIFTVTNRIKLISLVNLFLGLLSTIIVIVLLKTTGLEVYAVAAVSTVLSIIRDLLFTFPYAAKCLKQKWYVLYWPAFRTALSVLVVSSVFLTFRILFDINTWIELIGFGLLSAMIGIVLNIMIILSENEKRYLFDVATRKSSKMRKKY